MQLGVLIRLLANVLGMLNEHQRHDRDTYIYINENNIADNNQANLQKLTGFINASVYDYASITHAYSKVFHTVTFAFRIATTFTVRQTTIRDGRGVKPRKSPAIYTRSSADANKPARRV